MFHPVFDINKERFINHFSADFLNFFNKKIIFELAQPNIDDFLNEGNECFKVCNKKLSDNFEICIDTCLEKWRNLHLYLRSSDFSNNLLKNQEKPKQSKKNLNIDQLT